MKYPEVKAALAAKGAPRARLALWEKVGREQGWTA